MQKDTNLFFGVLFPVYQPGNKCTPSARQRDNNRSPVKYRICHHDNQNTSFLNDLTGNSNRVPSTAQQTRLRFARFCRTEYLSAASLKKVFPEHKAFILVRISG